MLIFTLAFDHCTKADQATQENRSSRTDTFIVQVPPLAHSAFQERTTAYLVRTIVCRYAFSTHGPIASDLQFYMLDLLACW